MQESRGTSADLLTPKCLHRADPFHQWSAAFPQPSPVEGSDLPPQIVRP